MSDTFLNLYDEFLALVDKGDESAAKKFLMDNFQKFPKDVQDSLTFVFFEEALASSTKGVEEIAEMQKEGMEALSQIGKARKALEDQLKIEGLKDKLTKQ
jgi:hypothetical protein